MSSQDDSFVRSIMNPNKASDLFDEILLNDGLDLGFEIPKQTYSTAHRKPFSAINSNTYQRRRKCKQIETSSDEDSDSSDEPQKRKKNQKGALNRKRMKKLT